MLSLDGPSQIGKFISPTTGKIKFTESARFLTHKAPVYKAPGQFIRKKSPTIKTTMDIHARYAERSIILSRYPLVLSCRLILHSASQKFEANTQ